MFRINLWSNFPLLQPEALFTVGSLIKPFSLWSCSMENQVVLCYGLVISNKLVNSSWWINVTITKTILLTLKYSSVLSSLTWPVLSNRTDSLQKMFHWEIPFLLDTILPEKSRLFSLSAPMQVHLVFKCALRRKAYMQHLSKTCLFITSLESMTLKWASSQVNTTVHKKESNGWVGRDVCISVCIFAYILIYLCILSTTKTTIRPISLASVGNRLCL